MQYCNPNIPKIYVIHINVQVTFNDSNEATTSARCTNSPPLNEHYQNYSHSNHNETLDGNCDTNVSASGSKTKDHLVDPNSLAVMERSQSPPIDDQQEASPNLGDPGPELGIYKDIGVPIEPKIHELKIAQQFIENLKNATLDNSTLDDWVCEWLCNPPPHKHCQ